MFFFQAKMGNPCKENIIVQVCKAFYRSHYHWTTVKSFVLFFVGIKIARECIGFEVVKDCTC